MLLIIEVIWA